MIRDTLAHRWRDEMQGLRRHLPDALDGHVKAVHRARVASRRLRETVALIQALARGKDIDRARREIRRVTRALGPVREIDVALETLIELAARHGWSRSHKAAVTRWLQTERARRRATLVSKARQLRGEWMGELDDLVDQALRAVPETNASRHVVVRRNARRAAAVAAAMARSGRLYAPARQHALRITIKKLRYSLEHASGILQIALDPELAVLAAMQQRFGQLHDMQMLLCEIESVAAAHRPTDLGEKLRAMADALERDCRTLHAEALAQFPALRDCLRTVRARLAASQIAAGRKPLRALPLPRSARASRRAS